jgi:hypothetical protein
VTAPDQLACRAWDHRDSIFLRLDLFWDADFHELGSWFAA